ncbi:hypothetical protein B0H14DRAFT_346719 [Mycena olivaceomarginata]|nr:hypothetical protein B0H14DRAFT_346719 [Mycena olivaceomarginata]
MEPAASDTSRERAARAADRSRIADIEAQILELPVERSLSSLKEEKDAIRARLAAYTYPVLTLPNETVSEIFVHFLPAFPRYPSVNRSSISLPSVPDISQMEGYSVFHPSPVERDVVVVEQGRETSAATPLPKDCDRVLRLHVASHSSWNSSQQLAAGRITPHAY